MSGLVLELQSEALNRAVRVADLMRKALVVSKKLGVSKIEKWLSHELNGYPPNEEIPPYREIRGFVRVWNPYHGWQPLHFGDPQQAEQLSRRKIMQPIGELDSLNSGKGDYQLPFPEAIKQQLMDAMDLPLEPSLLVPANEVVGILEAVRNTVLEWALELEMNGILGEGMTFSKDEKAAASQVTYQITNNIGTMSNSQLQQAADASTQILGPTLDLEELCRTLTDLKHQLTEASFDVAATDAISREIDVVVAESTSKTPEPRVIRGALESVRKILESAAGNLLAKGALYELGKYF